MEAIVDQAPLNGPTDGGSTYSMNVNHYQQPPPGAASQQPPPPPQQSAGGGPPQQQQPGPPMRVTMQHAAAMQQQAPPPQQQQPPPQQQQQPPPPHQQQHPTPTSTPPSAAADMAKTALVSPNHQMQQQTMSQMAYSQRASTNGGYRMGNPSQTRLQQNRNIVQVLQSPMPVGFQPLNNMSHLQNHHQHFPVPHYHTSGRQHAQGSSQIYYPPNLLPINFGTLPYNANYYVFAPNSVGSTGQYMTATTPVRQFATAGNPAAVTAGQMPPGMGGGAGHQVAAAAAAAAAAANQQAAVSMGINPAAAVAVATQSMMQQQQQPPMQSQQHQQQQQPQPQQQHLTKHQTKRRFAIPIIDPSTMKEREDITSSPSGSSTTPPISIDSSARQTPQPGVAVSQDTSDVAADQQQQQQTPSLPPHSHTPHHTEKPPAAAGGGDETRAGPEATPNGPTSLDISETQVPISEVKPASKPQPPATEKPAAAAAVAAVAAAASSVHSQEKEAQRDSTTTPIVSASDEITTTATPRTIVNAASAKGGAAAVAANSNQSPSKSLSKKQSRAAPSESASEKSLTQSPVVATATATSTPVATPPSASDTQPKPQATADAQPTIAAVGTQPVVQSPVVEAAAAAVTKKEATAAVEVAAPKEDTPKEVKTKATAKESAPAAAVQAPAAAVEQMPSFAQMINFTRLDKTPPQVIATPPPPAAPAPAPATAPEHQATNGELPTDSAEGKACQRQAMKKNKKLKEFNQKGAKKEGSEMDAFTENNLEEKEKTATTSPLTVNNKLPPSDVSSKDDLQEKLVAAKNEENIKVSALSKSDPATAAPDNNNIIGKAPAPAPTPTTLPAPQQPVLKHKYKEDQWSPLNPDGKKKYDRDFLMGLQNDPQATKKPDNLPNIDIVQLDAPNRNKFSNQMSYSSQPSRDNPHGFAPQFFKSSSLRGVRDTPPKRNSQQGKGGKGPMKAVHVSTSLREDKRLKDSENAWKPTRLKEAKDLTEEDKKTQELYKTVRSILNKLTPQKFDTLVGQVKKLPIDTRERLEGVINLVFDKAIAEPGYSKAYANMCKLVSNMEVKDSSSEKIDKNGENEKKVVFRKSLIMRCQSEFESNKNAELCSAKRLKEIDECTDPEKKRELQLSYEEEERRIRKKSVGNIRFIGELYILDMLTAPIMHRCINDLLRQHEEEPLECLCKLLTTIGKKLEIATNSVLENFKNDKSGSKPEIVSLDTYFATMKDLSRKSDNSKLSSRVRFMLQDVIDLKQNKWVPRRDENNPKTMDQIQREANRESLETSISLQAHRKQDMRGGGGGYGGDNDRRGGSGGRNRSMNQNDDKDGWQSVGSGKNYRQTSQTYSMDFHRLTMLKQVEETHNMTLGSSANFMNWRGGANAKSASIGDNKPSSMSMVTSSNKYDVLTRNTDRERDERKAPNITFKSTGGGGGGGGGGSGARISHSPSIEKERLSSDNKEDTERRSSSQRWSRVSQPSSRDHTPAPSVAPAPTPAPKASAPAPAPSADNQESLMKEIKRTAVATLEEFIGIKNFEETLQGVSAFTNPVDKKNLVKEMLDYASNTKTKPFQELGKLLVELVKVEYLTADPLLLTVFNEYIAYQIENEMWMDCPKIFQYISEVIVPLVQSSILSFSNLADLCKRQKDANDISTIHMKKMVAAIIEALTKEFSHEWVKNKWTSSKVEPSDFGFDTNNADDQKTLLFLSSTRSEAPTNSRMSMNEVQTKLVGFLQNDNMKFEDICDWINTNVGDDVQKPTFISALITAICEVSFKNSKKPFSETGLKIHSNLIRQYLSRYDAQDLEVQCLISVAAFVNKMEHPQGLLLIIFNYLWEASLISIESFISWKDRDGVEEGKGVALKSLVSFFTSLKEGDLSDGAS